MTTRLRYLGGLAGMLLLALLAVVCIAAFAQQPQIPSIPDDVIWEPAIQYATSGAMPVNLMMDVVRPRNQNGRLPAFVGGRANREGYLPLCIRLAQHGYVAATVS